MTNDPGSDLEEQIRAEFIKAFIGPRGPNCTCEPACSTNIEIMWHGDRALTEYEVMHGSGTTRPLGILDAR